MNHGRRRARSGGDLASRDALEAMLEEQFFSGAQQRGTDVIVTAARRPARSTDVRRFM
jgi:hypothetical protein